MLTSIAVILFCVPIVLCWRRCQRESESFGKAAWTVRVQPAAADGSGHVIGGLAVLWDAQRVEYTQGRLAMEHAGTDG